MMNARRRLIHVGNVSRPAGGFGVPGLMGAEPKSCLHDLWPINCLGFLWSYTLPGTISLF